VTVIQVTSFVNQRFPVLPSRERRDCFLALGWREGYEE